MIRNWGLLLYLMLCLPAFGQLADFDLQVTKTDESCLGNATLTFNVTNVTPSATFLFTVYQLPDTDVPISVVSTNVLGSLNAGSYRVVATQTLNNLSNSKQQDITIDNSMVPLTFSVAAANQGCTSGGKIVVNALTGTAVAFEILSGPVIRPQQTSNEFTNLPQGTYNIRVFNECGLGVVQAYTLLLSPTPPLIADTAYPDAALAGCNSVNISNTISAPAGSSISYPIAVEYVLTPPNGDPPITTTETFPAGGATVDVVTTVPLYGNSPYTYTMRFTDACGTIVTKGGNVVNPMPSVTHVLTPDVCGKQYLDLNIVNFMPPYNVAFVNAPAGFNPPDFNSSFPGPYTSPQISFGSPAQPIPEGNYEISVTDACGRSGSVTFSVVNTLPPPVVVGRNNGCHAVIGRIIGDASPRTIVSASIVSAPSGYTAPLPHNVSSSIIGGRLVLNNVPIGNYDLTIIDDCGNTFNVPVNVPAFVEQNFSAATRVDCAPGKGSVSVKSGNGPLTQISVTAAPPSFSGTLPLNVTSNIASATGELFMESLPEGSYTFEGTDACGIQRTVSVVVTGYQPDADPFTFDQHCGSFDVKLHDSGATGDASFWLQQLNEATQQWMHPQTGTIYPPGTTPDVSNSLTLSNNATLYNTVEEGKYRVVKMFAGYANATGDKACVEILGEFTFIDGIKINKAYTLACLNTPNDVLLEVEGGLAPYKFRITHMNGSPFAINNGSSNIFSNLTPAVYKFEVEDSCGNVDPAIINIATLPSLVQATNPGPLVQCVDASAATIGQTFDLASTKAAILGAGQSASQYTITFYSSFADASAAINALPESYQNVSAQQTVYARVVHNAIPICNAIAAFDIVVSKKPDLQMRSQSYICDGSTATLVADAGFSGYVWNHSGWSAPVSGQVINVDQPGDYTVTVTNSHGCTTDLTVTVTLSSVPESVALETVDWTTAENSITVNVSGPGNYEYSLDGHVFQPGNVFSHLETGVYTVYIKDANGCGVIDRKVALLSYPKFFTPNGDSYNERWRIEYAIMEPDMQIEIYDRMGKLLTSFRGDSEGWDGTYNGHRLPSTDYWFVVKRSNGRIFRGHFAMLR